MQQLPMPEDELRIPEKPEYAFSSLVEMLRYRAANQPDDLAYTFLLNGEEEAGSLTFSELDTRARSLATRLLSDLTPGDRALLLYPSTLDYVVAFFGCLYAGVVPVPSHPVKRNKPDRRLQSIVGDADPAALLGVEDTLRDLERQLDDTPGVRQMQRVATDRLALDDASAWNEPDVGLDSLAFLQYTSGSTSTPKGVMVSHGNLLQVMKECDLSWQFARTSKMVTWLPIFHDLGLIYGILQPVYSGIPCAFMAPLAFLQRPIRWLQAISTYQATHSAAPNFAYDLCAEKIDEEQRAGLDLSHWAVAMNGAEPVRAQTMRRFANSFASVGFNAGAFCPAYGLAEGTLKVTATGRDETCVSADVSIADLGRHLAISQVGAAGGDGGESQTLTLVSSGHAVGETCVVIADPHTGAKCPENRVGEIWVAGPIVAKGYWRRPKETLATFRGRLLNVAEEGPFLRTGDLGFMRDGECYVTGRLRDVIIIRGVNHYPQDIELTVQLSHEALRPDCGAAFSIDVDGEERLVIVQEVRRTFLKRLQPTKVFRAVRRAIFEHHDLQVQAIVLLRTASILKTSSGKIQRRACKATFLEAGFPTVASWTLAEGADAVGGPTAPPVAYTMDAVQQWMVEWVARRSACDPGSINPSAPFDACGLDSLSAVEFAHDLGEWIGRDIDAIIVWNYPTIEALSEHVANGFGPKTGSEISPISAAGDEPCLDDLPVEHLIGLLYDGIGRDTPED